MPLAPGTGPISGKPSLVVSKVPDQRNSMSSVGDRPERGELLRQQARLLRDQAHRAHRARSISSLSSPPMMMRPAHRRSRIEIILAVFPDQRAVLPEVLRLRRGRDGPARRHRLHGRMNDVGHDIAGRENHRARLDHAAVLQLNANRARRGVVFDGLALEQPGAPRDRDLEQPAGQLHRVGIRRARRHDGAGASDAEGIEQQSHDRGNRPAGRRARAADALRATLRRCCRRRDRANSLSRISQAIPSCSTSDFSPATACRLAR